MKRLNNIEETYKLVKEKLGNKLANQGYSLKSDEYHKESFGSRYTVWLNLEEKFAIRLIWDGRDSWFVLEESPTGNNDNNYCWSDMGIYPFDQNNDTNNYRNEIVNAILNELK